MPKVADSVRLSNGVDIPVLGLGTWQTRGSDTQRAVGFAIGEGYTHVDTAAIYRNEADVAEAIKRAEVPRERLFITTKLSPRDMGFLEAMTAFEKSLQSLGTSYVDLYLMHWPGAAKLPLSSDQHRRFRQESWRAMEVLFKAGKCRAIGVSNFTKRHLEELLSNCEVRPVINQVEFHPALFQLSLLEYCRSEDIQVEAYSPLGVGHLIEHPAVQQVAQRVGRSPAQVLIRWGLQHHVVVIPKSTHRDRIIENAGVFDFELSEADMRQLETVEQRRFCWDPSPVK